MTQTTSQRAIVGVRSIPRDGSDRDRLREEWRLLALEAVDTKDKADRAREGKSIFLDQLIGTLLEQNPQMKKSDAERLANTSAALKSYLGKMHEMRRIAAVAEIEAENANRIYWDNNNREADARVERRMAG